MTTKQDQILLDHLSNDQYLSVMREKVGPDTWDMLQAIHDNKDLPFGVRDLAMGLIEEYGSFDEASGATLGMHLRRWHASAWHLSSAVRMFEEVGR